MAEFAVQTVEESGEMNGSQNPDQSQGQTDTSTTNPAKPGDSIFASKEKDDPAKIFVGGLNACTTNDTLNTYFSTFGAVIDASVKYTHPQDEGMGNLRDPNDPGTRSRGFGFVLFESADVAQEVLNQQHIVDDKVIEVKKAVRQGQSKSKKLFVGGLANFISEEILNAYFSAFGAILETKIIVDHVTHRRRGFAFIQFEDESTVDTISEVRYHDLTSEAETCKVEVKPVLPNSKPPGGFRGRGGFRGDGRRGGFRGRGGYNQQQGGGNYNQWGGGYNQGGGRGGYNQGQDQSGYQQGSYYQGSYDQSGYNQPQYDQSYQNYPGYNYNYSQGYGQDASSGQYSNGSGYQSGYPSGYNTGSYGESGQQYNYGSNYGQEASTYGKAQGGAYQQQTAYQQPY